MASSSPQRQAAISSFFSQTNSPSSASHRKRQSTVIDLTGDSDEESAIPLPPTKRIRTTSSFFEPRKSNTREDHALASTTEISARPGGLAEQWRFEPGSSSQPVRHHEFNGRHEKAKRILLGETGIFDRSREEEVLDDEPVDSPAAARGDPDTGEESDELFSQMREMWASSSGKGKKKGKATTRAAPARKKKVEEIGPSGMPYTAMELQVRLLVCHCDQKQIGGNRFGT